MALTKKDKVEIAEMIAEAMGQKIDSLNSWDEGMEVKELKCGLKIAMDDYYEINENGSKKTKFTFDEALEIEKKTNGKWRVPTIVEWLQIVLELGTTVYGNLDRDEFVKVLNLTAADDDDGYGVYWSSSASSSTTAYTLYFYSGSLYPASYNYRGAGFFVRCVRGQY